jgi:serpin B
MSTARRVVIGLAIIALGGAAGCGSAGSSGSGSAARPGKTLVGHAQQLQQGSLHASDVAAADTAFGLDLFARLCGPSPDSNLTLSPASAAQALGMLDAGAAGPTRAAVARLLHLPAWSPAVVAALHDQTASLAKVSQVTVTNHVFEQTGVTPTQATLNDLQTAFDTDLRQLDFSQEPAATNAINAVIGKDTAGMIPKLFDQPLDGSTQTVLADAILLDAKWQQPFPDSHPGIFHTSAGSTVTTPLMSNRDGRFVSRMADGWQSVSLPYVGGTLQAVAMLPPASAPACAMPDPSTMTGLTSGPVTTAQVVLPKLDLSQTLPLTTVLAAMGLPLSGDYSGLGRADSQISQVVQKVVMKVDQSGTKATAATGIAVASSAVAEQPPVVSFDRPFLLVLQDTATHTPLFVARVANPTQQ